MTDATRAPVQLRIGDAAALSEGGSALTFACVPGVDGFAVRFRGTVHAWVNRCPHQGTPLDWEPGEFFDEQGRHLACATHGALFEPDSGRCVAGPCRGARLQAIAVQERDGGLYLTGVTGT
ncbi:MAG: Rieske 2Fe-2S domain-containing protein [Pseudomonadota bacterium]|nr:Rieske 2Fe-2S domain-containing protein [Pseudomonadota bacterium]